MGTSRYVRVYQDGEKMRSVGGIIGQIEIREFWDHQNPRSPMVFSYIRKIPIFMYDVNGNPIEDEVAVLKFPQRYKDCPELISQRNASNEIHYSGLIYLVEIQKRPNNHRRIRNIYVAEYIVGRLNSITKMHPEKRIWFKDGKIGFVDVRKGIGTMYTVNVFSQTTSTKIPIALDKHIIFDTDGNAQVKWDKNTKPFYVKQPQMKREMKVCFATQELKKDSDSKQ